MRTARVAVALALWLTAALLIRSGAASAGARATTDAGQPAQPQITSITPASGPTTGGTTVVIRGTNFTGTTQVFFGGVVTTFFFQSDTQLDTTSPAQAAGSVPIVVVNSAWLSPQVPADVFTYDQSPPAVTALSPISGSTAGGTTVTITGSGFEGATGVRFGKVAATDLDVLSDTSMTVTAPAQKAKVLDVTVSNAAGDSPVAGAEVYTYEAAPTVRSVTPRTGSTGGGTTVTIKGSGFIGATVVTFGIRAASSFTVLSASRISAVSPAQPAGSADVSVRTSAGISPASSRDIFTYR